MITNFFIPELNNHDVQELWFQQDGATCHIARAIVDLLKDTFGYRLISRFGPVNWPPRSCDLTPLDYFLWGYVKSLVYADKPQTLDHLEDNIRRVIADIRPQMLEKVIETWTSRLDYIRASRGSPMPEIIFKISFGTKEKNHYCAAARCRPLSNQEEESPLLRCEIVFNAPVCKKTSCVRSPQRTTAKEPLICFLMGFCAVQESRFTMESDSGRLLIWREQRTRYHQSTLLKNIVIEVVESWFRQGSRLGGHTELHVFHGGTVTRYRDETLDPYVRPYAAAIGNDFILMDDNARPHRARIVEEFWITVWNEWNSQLDLQT
ncbi:uncharacterized protein TNCV_5038471 [Trichonephila clavipes]|nr:uncharacterized protein TNCV_5038471 [Trichonephila clavipes]